MDQIKKESRRFSVSFRVDKPPFCILSAISSRTCFVFIHPWSRRVNPRSWSQRRVQEELALRMQNVGLTTQHDTEKCRESFLIWPIFEWNFNLQMGKSFNFIQFFFVFFMIRGDPSWSDPDWRSELIRSDFCTCLMGNIFVYKHCRQISFDIQICQQLNKRTLCFASQ